MRQEDEHRYAGFGRGERERGGAAPEDPKPAAAPASPAEDPTPEQLAKQIEQLAHSGKFTSAGRAAIEQLARKVAKLTPEQLAEQSVQITPEQLAAAEELANERPREETRGEVAHRVFSDWIFPLLVLGAIGAAIVYVCLATGAVIERN